MRIAPEGWPFILPGWALVAMGAWGVGTWGRWLWALEVVLLLLALWLIVFFRDPVRSGPRGERCVVARAERMGMIRFGSRVDVFLPAALHPVVRVAPGDRVRAGASVLAEYPE